MTRWNKDAPDIIGLQWPASRALDNPLTGGQAECAFVEAATTEAVDRMRVFVANPSGQSHVTNFDIYDAANMDHGPGRCYFTVPTTAAPSSITLPTIGWHSQTAANGGAPGNRQDAIPGPATNMHTAVDDSLDNNDPLSEATADWIRYMPMGPGNSEPGADPAYINFQFSPAWKTCEDEAVAAPAGTPIAGTDRVVSISARALIQVINQGSTEIGAPHARNRPNQDIDLQLCINSTRNGLVEELYTPGRPPSSYRMLEGDNSGIHVVRREFVYHTLNFTNTSNRRPVNVADVAQLILGGGGYVQVTVRGHRDFYTAWPGLDRPDSGSGIYIYSVWLAITCVDEKRLAYGDLQFNTGETSDASTPVWRAPRLRDPSTDAVSSFTKTAGHTYAVAMRGEEQAASGLVTWRAMDCGDTAGHEGDYLDGHSSARMLLNQQAEYRGSGLPAVRDPFSAASGFAGAGPSAYTLVFSNGLTLRADGAQPYTRLRAWGLWNSSHYFAQQFGTGHASSGYGVARLLIQNYGGQLGPLNVVLQRVPTAVGTYATESAAPEDLLPTDLAWQLHDVELDPSTPLNSAQEVWVSVQATNQAFLGPWVLGALDTSEEAQVELFTNFGVVTFGGTNAKADFVAIDAETGGASVDTIDAGYEWFDSPFQLLIQPPPLTGFGAFPASQALPTDLTGACTVTAIPYIALAWVPSNLGSSWRSYEVERFNPETGLWDRIADLTSDEADGLFADFEVPSGLEQGYRVRVRNTIGVPSPWSTILPSVAVVHAPWVLYLVSNLNPTRNCAFQYETPEQFVDVDGESKVIRKLFGRDKQIGFAPFEERGIRFTKNLIVAAADPAVTGGASTSGPGLFNRLRAICRDPLLPYVAVVDHYGNRWLTAPRITGSMTRSNPGEQHLASVEFVEVGTKSFPSSVTYS